MSKQATPETDALVEAMPPQLGLGELSLCLNQTLAHARRLERQRDELLAALQAILAEPSDLEYHDNEVSSCGLCKAVAKARAAIAAAEAA